MPPSFSFSPHGTVPLCIPPLQATSAEHPSVCSPPGWIPDEHSDTSQPPQTDRLGFIQLEAWNRRRAYDEQPPICIHYLIEWKVTLNNRTVRRVTEPDLVIAPSACWQNFLEEKVEQVKRRKEFQNRRVRLDDTFIVASVLQDRSQYDLYQQFYGFDIDWTVIEKQFLMWDDLFLKGKKLKLGISISYIGDDNDPSPSRKGDKRGTRSVTKTMLAERDAQLNADHSSGKHSVWRYVYRKMRCSGSPCQNSEGYC